MSFQPLKLMLSLALAALEVTLLHLGVSLVALAFELEPSLSWPALLLTCLAGAWTMARFEPIRDSQSGLINWSTLTICAVVMVYTVKIQAGGGWSPLSGWSIIWPFASERSLDTLSLFSLLMACLWCWWRGMSLVDADHAHVLTVLQRGVLTLVLVALLVTPLSPVNLGAPPWGQRLASEALLIAALGLIGLSLARIIDESESGQTGGIKYWLRSSLLTSLGVLLVGTLLLSLVSDAATLAIRSVAGVIVGVLALVMLPLFYLIAQVGQWLLTLMNQPGSEDFAPPSPLPSVEPATGAGSAFQAQVIQTLQFIVTLILYLLPLVLLIILIITMQRRRNQRLLSDGVLHESLWSWRRAGGDLLDLLKGLRLPARAQGLRDALARLRPDDPAERIRRRYIELLLLGEGADRPRQPQQTPLEYAPVVGALTPGASRDLQSLTDVYDQARYAPDTITPADADTADAAWAAIQAQSPKEKS
ncbi:MAG TPA: DUF4129 domain-containing protein [Herpetosiphonaceae bacterium]